MAANILDLNRPMAPRLIQILYWIALLLIALGVVRGVIGGVRMMTHPMPQAAIASDQGAAAAASQPAQPPQGDQTAGTNPQRREFGPRRFQRGPGFAGRHFMRRGPMMDGPLLRGLPPAALGGLRILLALFRGLVILLVVRVLAEIGIAILGMAAWRDSTGNPAL